MKKQLVWQTLLTIFMLLVWALLYPKLPSTLPMHWNINGNIDHFAPKSRVMLMLISLLLLSTTLYVIIPFIDPKRRSFIYSLKNYNRIQVPFFLVNGPSQTQLSQGLGAPFHFNPPFFFRNLCL
ncbi:DUF1648 domain-containing protein [Heyndrickxia acidiproducens]|uniref:DUF1648 domain-containing protein n=1 Tax=Heyndrickxia acidiproducens TaxID=1121084 RepID=UPI0009D9DCCF|nr:DUF1648 domain-containing protein [Heyndrickxia acidiproducens]